MGDGLRRMDGGPWTMDDGRYCQVREEQRKRGVMVVLLIVVCWTGEWKGPQSSPHRAMNEGRERLLSLLLCGRIERKREKRNGIVAVVDAKENGYVTLTIALAISRHIERKGEKRNGIVVVSTKRRINTSSCPSILPFLVALSCSA